MPVTKLTIQEFASKMKEKFPKMADINDTLLTRKLFNKYPGLKDAIQITDLPDLQTGQAPIDVSSEQSMNQNVANAQPFISDVLQKHGDKAIDKVMDDYFIKQNVRNVSGQDATYVKAPNIQRLPEQREQDINDYKTQMIQHPEMITPIVSEIARIQKDKSADIKAAMYATASKDRIGQNARQIADNYSKIKSGELDYDINHERVIKLTGLFKSYANAVDKRNKDVEDMKFWATAPEGQVLQKYYDEQSAYNPDQPVEKGNLLGQGGGFIGSQQMMALKGGLGGLVGGAGFGPEGAEIGASLGVAHEMAVQNYSDNFKRHLTDLLHQNVEPTEAVRRARDLANTDTKIDAATGLLLGKVGTSAGTAAKYTPITRISDSWKKAITDIAKNTGKFVVGAAPSGGANAMVAAGMQGLKNLNEGKDWGEGTVEAALPMLALHYSIAGLSALGKAKLSPKAHQAILDGVSRLPKDVVESEIDRDVHGGLLQEDDANQIKSDLNDQRNLNKGLPDDTPPENKQKAQDLIKKRDELKSQIDPDNPNKLDEAIAKNIKEQIDGVKKVKADGTTEGKDGLNQQIRNLTEPQKETPSPTFKTEEPETGEPKEHELAPQPKPEPEEQPAEQAPTGGMLESRHAYTDPDVEGMSSSSTSKDELNDRGVSQAKSLGNELKGKGINKVIAPDMVRTKETAGIVSDILGLKTEVNPKLNSWDTGEFNNVKSAEWEKAQEYFVKHPDETEFEGKKLGESFNTYKNRLIPAREELEKEPASTFLVNNSTNMKLWDAFVKNEKEWTEKTEDDFLKAKEPKPASLEKEGEKPEEIQPKEQVTETPKPERGEAPLNFLDNEKLKGKDVTINAEEFDTGKTKKIKVNALQAHNLLKKKFSILNALIDCV